MIVAEGTSTGAICGRSGADRRPSGTNTRNAAAEAAASDAVTETPSARPASYPW
jgi:hypothetical protein